MKSRIFAILFALVILGLASQLRGTPTAAADSGDQGEKTRIFRIQVRTASDYIYSAGINDDEVVVTCDVGVRVRWWKASNPSAPAQTEADAWSTCDGNLAGEFNIDGNTISVNKLLQANSGWQSLYKAKQYVLAYGDLLTLKASFEGHPLPSVESTYLATWPVWIWLSQYQGGPGSDFCAAFDWHFDPKFRVESSFGYSQEFPGPTMDGTIRIPREDVPTNLAAIDWWRVTALNDNGTPRGDVTFRNVPNPCHQPPPPRCNNIDISIPVGSIIPADGAIVKVVVNASPEARFFRLGYQGSFHVIAGPQASNEFNELHLPGLTYQAQVSADGVTWSGEGCDLYMFTAEEPIPQAQVECVALEVAPTQGLAPLEVEASIQHLNADQAKIDWDGQTSTLPVGVFQDSHTFKDPGYYDVIAWIRKAGGPWVTTPACEAGIDVEAPKELLPPPLNVESIHYGEEDNNACTGSQNYSSCMTDRKLKRLKAAANGEILYHPIYGIDTIPAERMVTVNPGTKLPQLIIGSNPAYDAKIIGALSRITIISWQGDSAVPEVVATRVTTAATDFDAPVYNFVATDKGPYSPDDSFNGMYVVQADICNHDSVVDEDGCSSWHEEYRQLVRVEFPADGVVFPWIQSGEHACIYGATFALNDASENAVITETPTWTLLGSKNVFNDIEARWDQSVQPKYSFLAERSCQSPNRWGPVGLTFDLFTPGVHTEPHLEGYTVFNDRAKHQGEENWADSTQYSDPPVGWEYAPGKAARFARVVEFFGFNTTSNEVGEIIKVNGQLSPAAVSQAFSANDWEHAWASQNLPMDKFLVKGIHIDDFTFEYNGVKFSLLDRPWFVDLLSRNELQGRIDALNQGLRRIPDQ